MKNSIFLIVICWALLNSQISLASQETIEVKSQAFTISLEKHLKLIKNKFPGDPNAIQSVIEEIVLPYVDSKYFALKVLGKHASKMTVEQRKTFIDLLKSSMVNNYIAVLKHYNNETLILETIRKSESGKTAKTVVKIDAAFNYQTKDKKINLIWRFNKDKGTWKIYDLEAEGISLLQSKQKEISSLISQQGIDSMLALLSHKANK